MTCFSSYRSCFATPRTPRVNPNVRFVLSLFSSQVVLCCCGVVLVVSCLMLFLCIFFLCDLFLFLQVLFCDAESADARAALGRWHEQRVVNLIWLSG